ncbi:FAD binding domain protein [Aspergillus sp. HF37]|nr:FAD binding domain protein [Aspergillus sp. HF37]
MVGKNNPASNPTNPLDVFIIGAGPCGLAVAARLQESTPSALFTDEEHQRYLWIRRHGGRVALAGKGKKKQRKEAARGSRSSPKILVLDSSSPAWLEKWHRSFRTLEIAHLRSPMFFHVDPGDRDGMLAYTRENRREGELGEISGCVGKEISKHRQKKRANSVRNRGAIGGDGEVEIDERDRKDYFAPSSALFADYSASIVERYGLDLPGLVVKGEACDIQYGDDGNGLRVFSVRTTDGREFYARAVVLAIGPGRTKIYPFPLSDEEKTASSHSSEIGCFPSPRVQGMIQQRRASNVVVVGGGLTSAQIVDLAVRRGVTRVWHLMRSDVKVKHFDIALPWMGKFKNYEKAAFWSADTDEERLEKIQAARNGGSITPHYLKILKQHVARRRVSIHPRTVISERRYCPDTQTWQLTTDPPIPDLPAVDHIYFATGVKSDVNELPLLQRMQREYPIETKQGLPCITDDLMWQADVPLFVTGRLAALRLGPGAGNLEGARMGAERVTWGVEETLEGGGNEMETGLDCLCGMGNRYERLSSIAG